MTKKLFPPKLRVRSSYPHKTIHPKAQFYHTFGFITQSEYDQILQGQMVFRDHGEDQLRLLNLNAPPRATLIPTGVAVKLYRNRAEDINLHLLFGTPLPDME